MRVLIIRTSSLGDIIHALPVLDYLHQAMPGIAIDWAVEEQFRDLLEGNPLLSGLHIVRTRAWRKRPLSADTLREVRALRKALKFGCYDIVFDIQGNLKSGVLAWLSGAEKRFGFTRDFLQESVNALFTNYKIPHRKQDNNATTRYLRVVSAAFEQDYDTMDLAVDIATGPNEERIANDLIRSYDSEQLFLFHGGTTWQTKFWSEAGWLGLGKVLHEKYPNSMILFSWGNDAEKLSAERVAAGVGGKVHVLAKYSLKGIAAIIKKVDLVVGGDTGLIHLAAAVGTPTVSYYRASDGSVSGPRGPKHIIVQSPLACTRCFQTRCDKDSQCRDSITVDAILAGIEKLQPCFGPHTGQLQANQKGRA